MKLIDKFIEVEYAKYVEKIDINLKVKCVEIAEDFAIGFAEWLREECYDTGLKWYYQKDNEEYTNIELLEIYKKENEL
jgi:hypothetical protein